MAPFNKIFYEKEKLATVERYTNTVKKRSK